LNVVIPSAARNLAGFAARCFACAQHDVQPFPLPLVTSIRTEDDDVVEHAVRRRGESHALLVGGDIDGESVKIESSYKTADDVDAKKSNTNDMLLKTATAIVHSLLKRRSRYIHARGCPLSVAQHVNYLSAMAKIKNPNFDPRLLIPVNIAYWQMRFFRFLNRFIG
jgi:hypothetical protein